jgi:hypothetical protein
VAELLTSSSGQARYRVDWAKLRTQKIPLLPYDQQRIIGDQYRAVLAHEQAILDCQAAAQVALAPLELDGEIALDRLIRSKPPR